MPILLIALGITLLVEVPIVTLFYKGQRWRIAAASVVANAATNLAMNYLLLKTALAYDPTLLGGEAVALLFEAIVYAMVDRQRDWVKALTASAAANLTSFSVGVLFPGVFRLVIDALR